MPKKNQGTQLFRIFAIVTMVPTTISHTKSKVERDQTSSLFIIFVSMMDYFIPLLVALSLGIDYLFWRSHWCLFSPRIRYMIYGVVLFASLLPLFTILEGKLRTDNLPEEMIFCSNLTISLFLYALLRMILYVGWLSRYRIIHLMALLVAIGCGGVLTHSLLIGRNALRLEQVTIRSAKLPQGWQGARLLHFSDLHVGTLKSPIEECRRLVDTILALRPDMILFTGDLTNIRHTELTPEVMCELSRLRAPLGVFSVTGNHDVGVYIKDSISLPHDRNRQLMIRKEQAMGWCVLENENRYAIRHGDTITLTGIGFDPSLRNLRHARHLPEDYQPWGIYDTLNKDRFNLTLVHLPQLWDNIRARGYGDLTLSGHVHSMQHKLPIGRRGWSLAALFYKYWSGLYEAPGSSLYINDGIGTVGIPARLGAPSELTLITLEGEE